MQAKKIAIEKTISDLNALKNSGSNDLALINELQALLLSQLYQWINSNGSHVQFKHDNDQLTAIINV